MILEIILSLLVILVLYAFFTKDPPPVLGIYSQPGKWFYLKKALFIALLTLRKYSTNRKKQANLKRELKDGPEKDGSGYGVKSRSSIKEMDCAQPLSSDDLAIDCKYFNGLDAEGNYILLRIARRNNRHAEIWLSINVVGVGFFQSPIHPDTTLYNVDQDSFNAGGLKFECLEPMNRWKVTFNGLLRKGLCNTWAEDEGEIVHVRFSFIWKAFTDPFDFDTDIYPACIAIAVAREPWSREYFERLKQIASMYRECTLKQSYMEMFHNHTPVCDCETFPCKSHQTHYEQWGELHGTVLAEGYPEKILYLRGYRDHSYGVRDWYSFHRYAIHFAYLQDGSAFHVDSVSMPGTLSLLQCGYMSRPNAIMHPVSWTDMDFLKLGENQDPPLNYEFNFTAGGINYHAVVRTHTVIKYYMHDDWRSVIFEHVSHYEVNGIKGYGIFEFVYRNPRREPVHKESILPVLKELADVGEDDCTALVLPFTNPACTSSRLVGGKGCQLALLTQLPEKEFNVPAGFCLTLKAFELQMDTNPVLREVVRKLHDYSCSNNEELKQTCEATMAAFKTTVVHPDIQAALKAEILKVFGNDFDKFSFAVRSSAAGEDGSEMSAAGQMETVLGVKGIEKILEAVAFCWASHFSYIAVAYRRQHGQPIKSSAGVVIQKMALAKAAGVLFTRDPLTGNPGLMIVNANFGLGESVVSGESDPDQVTLKRTWNDKVSIVTKKVGKKGQQVRLTPTGETENVKGSETDSTTWCMSDESLLKLAAVGIELEKRFSNPRDIEFAVGEENELYILQARPITALDTETEWHLMHEFDSPLAMDKELLTTANIQEMMPGAMTPLTLSFFISTIQKSLQQMTVNAGVQPCVHYANKSVPVFYNHGFLNLLSAMGLYEGSTSIGEKRMVELSILGETLSDYSIKEVEMYHGVYPIWKRLMNAVKLIRNMRTSRDGLIHLKEIADSFSLTEKEPDSSRQLYDDITKNLPLFSKASDFHLLCSAESAIWSNVLMVIISQRGSVWTAEHYSDVALMLSNCADVYSADVPAALKKLAVTIAGTEDGKQNSMKKTEELTSWLMSESSGHAGTEFREFLRKHGHRCIREAELREKSWQTDPSKVVKVLQAMMGMDLQAQRAATNNLDIVSLINSLKSKTTWIGRLSLRYVLPKARIGVGKREFSKSLFVKTIEAFKQAYWKLADMMVNESRLPDRDLLVFFTHQEIGVLLETRSAKLIARAQRRRQLLAKQMLLKFPRIIFGHATPIEEVKADDRPIATSFKVKGLPVSQGVVHGTARVITSLEAASAIESGDILIAKFTDVGWSPYFPMISGLVTEIGGLLSHGAVVAREYGLPCVVNITNATMLFQSGDQVILNGTLGTLEKVAATIECS